MARPGRADAPLSRWVLSGTLGAAFLLGGCVEDFPQASVGKGDIRNAIAKGTMVSPRAATVAMASFEGAPAGVAVRFSQAFAREAADREIALTDPQAARYLIRGYMSAYPADGGTDVSYVYDVFDADQRRIDRVTDVMTLPGSGEDSWSLVDDRVMASLAGRSADDLAVALARMPEAQAAPRATASATPAAGKPAVN